MQAKRGRLLSVLILIFGAAISLATIVLIFRRDVVSKLGNFPSWFTLYLVILLLGRLIALFGIWNMKRWGVYAFFVFECIEVGMGLFVLTSVFSFQLRLLVAIPALLVIIAIWYQALRKKWQAFTWW